VRVSESGPTSIDALLQDARRGLKRLDPIAARRAVDEGALLVDTRPVEQRNRDGEIPGALVIDRNVLEWRLDPAGPHRIAGAPTYDQVVIIVCNEGYASSLAAATLQRLGLRNATDLDGGYQAWRAAGLPTTPIATNPSTPAPIRR
jgi:rhodanese-related sulfurtransferase